MKSRTKEGAFYCLNDIEDFALGPKNTLFAACGNQSGHLFNTEVLNNELIHDDEDKCRNAVVDGMAISKDYRFIATAFGLKGFKMYSTVSKKELYYQDYRADSICFSPADSNIFAIGGDRTIRLIDVEKYWIINLEIKSMKRKKTRRDDETVDRIESDGRPPRIDDLFFSWDGQYICSIIDGNELVLNTTWNGREVLTLHNINFEYQSCATFIPNTNNHNILFVNSGKTLTFYQVSTLDVTEMYSFDIEGKIRASAFTCDGKYLLLCVDDALLSLEFSISHGIDPSALNRLMPLEGLDVSQIKVSPDDEFVILSAGNSIVVCSLSKLVKEASSEIRLENLYEICVFGDFRSMCFRPPSIDLKANHLAVTYNLYGKNRTRIYEIMVGINPTFCHSILEGGDITSTLPTYFEHHSQAPLKRNESGETFLSAAVKGQGGESNFDRVHELVKRVPQNALALIPPSKNKDDFPGVAACLASKNYLTSVDALLTSGAFPPFTPEIELVRIRDNVLPMLIDKQAIDSLEKFFDAGAKDCVGGYVPGVTSYYLDTPKSRFASQILSKLRLEPTRVPSIGDLPPQTSPFPADLSVFSNYDEDPNKRIKLKQMRVLFPGLANQSTLEGLLNDQSPDRSALLKLFQKESLRTSIDANWESWAKRIFMRQFMGYLLLLLSLTLLTFMNERNGSLHIVTPLYAVAFIGLLYFLRLFFLRCIAYRSASYLLINGWNGLQATFLASALTFTSCDLCLRFFPLFYKSLLDLKVLTEARAISAAFAQLLGWMNILYYSRGNEDLGWIVFALIRVIWRMLRFVMILSHIVFAFTLFFLNLELYENFVETSFFDTTFWRKLGDTFLSTFSIVMLSEIELAAFTDEMEMTTGYTSNILQLVIKVLVVVVICLICLNAMIAFVSEEFADVLSDKDAVLARERASVLVDLYSCMGVAFREKVEMKNKWVYKLVTQSSLERINNEGDRIVISKSLANRRATKSDIFNTRKHLMTHIQDAHVGLKIELNDTIQKNIREAIGSENEKIKLKLVEQVKENEALKSYNNELKAEMMEIKGMLVELLSK